MIVESYTERRIQVYEISTYMPFCLSLFYLLCIRDQNSNYKVTGALPSTIWGSDSIHRLLGTICDLSNSRVSQYVTPHCDFNHGLPYKVLRLQYRPLKWVFTVLSFAITTSGPMKERWLMLVKLNQIQWPHATGTEIKRRVWGSSPWEWLSDTSFVWFF